jgi:hypothetical protein
MSVHSKSTASLKLLLLLGSCGVTHGQCCLTLPRTDCGAAGRNTTVTYYPCMAGQRVSLYVDWRDSNIGGGPQAADTKTFNGQVFEDLNESISFSHVYSQPGKYRPVIKLAAYINDTSTEKCIWTDINTEKNTQRWQRNAPTSSTGGAFGSSGPDLHFFLVELVVTDHPEFW